MILWATLRCWAKVTEEDYNMAGDNRFVTENFLRLNFTPNSGVTPGTNDTLWMNCDEILARYNVSISGATSTGLRWPSQNQVVAINPPIVNPTLIFYQRQVSMGSIPILSIEISTNGSYLYLMYPSLKHIRRYTLSTPFDISTMGSYQTFDYSFLGFTPTYSGGLFLSPDQKKLSFLLDTKAITVVLNTANDLTTELYTTTSYLLDTSVSFYYPQSLAFDPTGYFVSIVTRTSGSNLRVIVLQSSVAFEFGGTLTYVSQALFTTPITSEAGFEFNGDGTKMYIMEAFNQTVLHSYVVSPTAYQPSNTSPGIADLGSQDFYLGSLSNVDYCFSDDLTHMYVIGSANDSTHPIIYQYSMSE